MQNYRTVLPLCFTSLAWFTSAWADNPPVADFEVISNQELSVRLLNSSTDPDGDALKFKWNFGDSTTSASLNPLHTYSKAGTYKITLKVSDGKTAVKTSKTVTVNSSPVSDFEVVSKKGLKLSLGSKASDPDGDPLTYLWSFGDGGTSTEKDPVHTYAAEGTYKITLKVSDGKKTVKSAKSVEVIPNRAPAAGFEIAANDDLKVNLQNSSSDPDGDSLKYKWTFGDGTTSKEQNPVHVYAKAGTYKISLKVSDGSLTNTVSKSVTVKANQAPVAGFEVAENKDLMVNLQNSSSDPDGDKLKYKWNFGDGTTSKEQNPVHVYAKAGTYKVSLKVSDGKLTNTYTQKIKVNSVPQSDFAILARGGLSVRFESMASDPDGDTLKYRWDFGDGTESKAQNPEHVYETAGVYDVTLTVSDGTDNSESSRTVRVYKDVDFALRGQVVGYLENAKVCMDLDGDSQCSDSEPMTETDGNGLFSFDTSVDATLLNDTGYSCIFSDSCGESLPLRVVACSTPDTLKYTLGKQGTLDNAVAMSSTVFMSAVNESSDGLSRFRTDGLTVVNPFTTLTDYSVRNYGPYELTAGIYADALAMTADRFGLLQATVSGDYNYPGKLTEETRNALVTGEVLTRTGILPDSPARMHEIWQSNLTADELLEKRAESVKEDISYLSVKTANLDNAGIADEIETFSADSKYSFVKIAAHEADEYKCGLNKTGNVYCWGNNYAGNLGDPDVFPKDGYGLPVKNGARVADNYSARPVKVKVSDEEYLSNVIDVYAANGHACAVTYDGALYCWGSNVFGQAGIGVIDSEHDRVFYATRVVKGQQETEGDYLSNVASVTLTHNASCALTRNGEVYCFGENSVKQLGSSYPDDEIKNAWSLYSQEGIDISDLLTAVPYPVKVNFPDAVAGVKELVGGYWAYCALVENNDGDPHNLYCWGDDINGLVSHNWKQYLGEYMEKYAPVLMTQDLTKLADPDGTAHWFWHIYVPGGEWHPLFGQGVTQIRNAVRSENDEGLEFTNVTKVAIGAFDARLVVEKDLSSLLYGIYNQGTSLSTDWWSLITSDGSINGQKAGRVESRVEDIFTFLVSDTGSLYAFDADVNLYGMYGIGKTEYTFNWDSYRDEDGHYIGFITNPVKPVAKDGGMRWYLSDVADVAAGKRSVCALTAKKDDDGNRIPFRDLYCWGSSTFGQLGFDNGDGGFSYWEIAGEWTGYTSDNLYFDKPTRIEYNPKKITFSDSDQ